MIMLSKRYCSLKSLGFGNVEDRRLRLADLAESDFGIINEKTWESKSKQEVIMGIFKGRHWPTRDCLSRYDDDDVLKTNYLYCE
ncbi:hypothetical protein TNCV_3716871 [Trichonephila clavipes]|nr:hypothetical protein TNCV_3716871 [Trichonephila clavipes]